MKKIYYVGIEHEVYKCRLVDPRRSPKQRLDDWIDRNTLGWQKRFVQVDHWYQIYNAIYISRQNFEFILNKEVEDGSLVVCYDKKIISRHIEIDESPEEFIPKEEEDYYIKVLHVTDNEERYQKFKNRKKNG